MLVKYLVRYRYQLSLYANIKKAKECKGNEGKPIFCSGLLVFIWSSVKTEEEPHQYFTQGFYFIRGVASAAREEMCQENNGDTVFAFCYYTEPKKNLEERSPLPLFSAGSPIRQMRFATYFYGKKSCQRERGL